MSHDAAGTMGCNRRQILRGLVAAGFGALAGCRTARRHELRAGFLPNLTHAVPMVIEQRGKLSEALGRPVTMVPFSAGPSLIEALFAGDLDLGWCGPSPAINAYVRSGGKVRVVAASTYGGAALVVRRSLDITSTRDLKRARISPPQLGNTQDVALREWLADNDLISTDRGGTVQVVPMPPADILSLFRSKEIDAAWVVEPWVSRLVAEGNGRVFVDESELHPNGVYPTTLLVVTSAMLAKHREAVGALAAANASTVAWVSKNPASAKTLVNASLERHAGKGLSAEVLASAWSRLSFGTDPVLRSLRASAVTARRLGYLPHSDISGIIVEPEEWAPPATAMNREKKK